MDLLFNGDPVLFIALCAIILDGERTAYCLELVYLFIQIFDDAQIAPFPALGLIVIHIDQPVQVLDFSDELFIVADHELLSRSPLCVVV